MKTLINKDNPQIRITAPEIEVHEEEDMYFIPVENYCIPMCIDDWELVEEGMLPGFEDEEPTEGLGITETCVPPIIVETLNRFGWKVEKGYVEEEEVETDFEKLALEKYPETMTYDNRGLYDRKKYDRDIYLQGLKVGYELGRKGGNK